ncbi:MAG TPA: dihydroneopterin aldolase [Acidimicrobiia bacterium]|nr:dihydroneopterin aldolase [Acidimicrobiia bacterium]
MDRVLITGLRESGIHGVLPEERTRAQPFEVDVELSVDLTAAGVSDALADTVDYALVADAVSRVVRDESHQLLERLAARIADECRTDARVVAVVVTVRKLEPPMDLDLDHVAVRIQR